MAKKLTQKEVLERFKTLHNGEYELLSEYTKSTEPITIRHKPCSTVYVAKRAKSFLKEDDCTCPNCRVQSSHSTKGITEEELKRRLYNDVKDEYTYISGFVSSSQKVLIRHNVCGTEYMVTPHMLLGRKKRRCPVCGNKNRGKYALKENYLENLLKDKEYGDEYEWLEPYQNNNKIKHHILHKKCGNDFYMRPNDFQQGYVCPICSSSKEQKEIYDFIKSIYSGKVLYNYKIDRREIDIYIPEFKLGIEYNGFYWHSDKNVSSNYHLDKLNLFKEKGIQIFFIESYQWMFKKEIVKNKLRYLLKDEQHYFHHIYARNTKVKFNLSLDKKRKFLDKFHIQGYCNDTFNLYLVYNKKIVALMTFGFNRRNVNLNGLELLRYVTHGKYTVVGGFSKLLHHAIDYIKENYPDEKEIITYADLSISSGNLYTKNNFELDHISKPSYYYTNRKNEFINRYKYRKSELKKIFPKYYKDNLTEKEIVDSIPGIFRMWNCGNLVFKYYIK